MVGKLLLDGPVLIATLCALPVFAPRGGQVRKVNLALGLGSQRGPLIANRSDRANQPCKPFASAKICCFITGKSLRIVVHTISWSTEK
jgi:hypothetical protein